jgi:NADH-quinone oxidoreductase subunit H
MIQEAFLVILIKAVVVVFVVVTTFAYLMLLERKLMGRMQLRYGPNRTGPFGLLQPAADLVKMLLKEDFTPAGANKVLFQLAPVMAVFAAIGSLSVIPFGDSVTIFGHHVNLYGADLNVGLLLVFALSGIGFYGLILGGYSSGNKYALLGAARSAAQLVSYEVAMGLSVVGVVMLAQSLSLVDIVHAQADTVWYIVLQPVGFLLFMLSGLAETNRPPFDLPEAEGELVAGYHTEYGGTKFAGFAMAEYLNMIVVSCIAATLFLGGFSGPWLPGPIWLAIKVFILIVGFIWIRATMPRLRYDRLMKLGWKILLPLATLNLLITALVVGLGFPNK